VSGFSRTFRPLRSLVCGTPASPIGAAAASAEATASQAAGRNNMAPLTAAFAAEQIRNV